jgi:hypothetical protein
MAANAAAQFAADVVSAIWSNSHSRPYSHVAFDGGAGLARFYARLMQMDAGSLGSWPGVQSWLTREMDLVPGSERCVVGYVINNVLQKTRMEKHGFHPVWNPNVTHVNALARRLMDDNRLDLAIVLFPKTEPLAGHTLGRPDTPAARAALKKWGAATLGDDEEDMYVSVGTGMQKAHEEDLEARAEPGYVEPKSEYLASELGLPMTPPPEDRLPPNMTMHEFMLKMNPYFNLPTPPMRYKGTVDIRLSSYAVRSARQVFVVLPGSVLKGYKERAVEVAADGTTTTGVDAGRDGPGVGGAELLTPELVADIAKLVAGRQNVRVYVEELA